MTDHRAAEWLLTRLTNHERAAEIIGDLLEQAPGQSITWPVAQIIFSLAGRWVVACLLAPWVGLLIWYPRSLIVGPRVMGYIRTHPHLHHFPHEPWMLCSDYLNLLAFGFATVAVLAGVRYGFRQRVSGVSVALTLLAVVTSCLTWTPHSGFTITSAWALAIALLMVRPSLRRPTAYVFLASLCFCCVLWPMRFVEQYPHSGHTHVVILYVCVLITANLLAAWLLQRTQRQPLIA
jgi:hypothetical protein